MRDVNLAGLDLNLLPALDALLRRRSVTLAASDVGLSQPAMSRALARLRAIQGDPLLVRTPRGYSLTPKAERLRPQLAAALAATTEIFRPHAFDPASERRLLRFIASDAQTVLLVPALMARLAEQAPGVDVRIEGYGPDLPARLVDGSIDFAFALTTTPLPPGVVSEPVFADRLALVMRAGHPDAERTCTLADYGRYGHVGVALLGDGRSDIDTMLAAAGVTRRMTLVTPHFMAALAAVAGTDMVTTVSAALARRFAPALGLVLRDPPVPETTLITTLVSSAIRASDPFVGWVRALTREVGEGLHAETGGGTSVPFPA